MMSRAGNSPDAFLLGGWVALRRSPKPFCRSSPIRSSRRRPSRWTVGCTPVSAVGEQTGGRELGKLSDKVAIVTGGRGIGRVMTHAYLQEDAGVVVIAAREKAEIGGGLGGEAGLAKALLV